MPPSNVPIQSAPNPDAPLERSVALQIHAKPDRLLLFSFLAFYIVLLFSELRVDLIFADPANVSAGLLVLIALPGLYLLSRPGLFKTKSLPALLLGETTFRTPMKLGRRRYKEIPYDAITAIDTRGNGRFSFHLVQTKKHLLYYPITFFPDPDEWSRLPELLLSQIAKLPDGTERIERLSEQADLSKTIFSRSPIATIVLAVLMTAMFCLQVMLFALEPQTLPGLGANSSLLVHQGELYRLITSSFLHAGYIHITLNLVALLALGYIVEAILGSHRFVIIYFFALISGSLASVVSGSVLSVGASAGIFGLLGALLVINLTYKERLPAGLVMSHRWWVVILAINLGLPILIPKIDILAHCGGFIAGAWVTALLLRSFDLSKLGEPTHMFHSLVYYGILLLVCVSIAFNAEQFRDEAKRKASNLLVMNHLVEHADASPDELNDFSWDVAIDQKADSEMLVLADKAIRKSLTLLADGEASEQSVLNLEDTRATVAYRLGKFDEAIQVESSILSSPDEVGFDKQFAASQLERFLSTRAAIFGIFRRGMFSPVAVTAEPIRLLSNEYALELNVDSDLPFPFVAYLVGSAGPHPKAMVKVQLQRGVLGVTLRNDLFQKIPSWQQLNFRLVGLDAASEVLTLSEDRDYAAEAWPLLESVKNYGQYDYRNYTKQPQLLGPLTS